MTPLPESSPLSIHRHIHREIVERRVYLPTGSGLRLPPSGRVLDVGANVGVFSLWAARQCPGVQLLALEPAPPRCDARRPQRSLDGLPTLNPSGTLLAARHPLALRA